MQNELVSIIIPVYNVEKYIERCIESVLNQTLNNYEVIIVDDGSIDGTASICDNYAKKYKNIFVIHKNNAGLGYARNTGIENAQGKYIVFLDGDDFIGKDHLLNLYNSIKDNNADTCMCGYSRHQKDGTEIENRHIYANQTFDDDEIITKVIPKLCGKKPDKTDNIEMSVCMAMFSCEIIKKNNLRFCSEREMISEDLIFDLDYYKYAKRISFSEDTSYRYCNNEGTLTTKYRQDRFEKQVVLEQEVSKRVKELNIYNLCDQRIYNTLISIARYSIKLEVKFSSQNGRKNCLNNIKKICENEYLIEALKKYNNEGASWKNKMVNSLVKGKKRKILYFVMKIKNCFNI